MGVWVKRLPFSHTPIPPHSGTFLFLPSCPGQLHDLIWRLAGLQQELALGLEGAGGADADALAAEDAGGFGQGPAEEGADLGLEAAAFEVDGVGVLGVVGA